MKTFQALTLLPKQHHLICWTSFLNYNKFHINSNNIKAEGEGWSIFEEGDVWWTFVQAHFLIWTTVKLIPLKSKIIFNSDLT